jgi:hypothetical protein
MALPRVGMGVGGLLLGERRNGAIRLLNSLEIPCSHTGGPSFHLTEVEKEHVAELVATVGKAGVIGWYCSKPRGTADLGDAEIALYQKLFPGAGQIAMVVRPSTVQPTRAAFFFQDEKGDISKGFEFEIEAWVPDEPEMESSAESSAPEIQAAPEPEEPVVTRVVTQVATRVAAIEPIAAKPEPPPPLAGPDMFAFTRPPEKKNGLGGILTTAAALALVVAGFFLAQNYWNPRPPLTLTSTPSDGKLLIRWNVDALRGIDRASMFVNDGGNLQSLTLARSQLDQGILVYIPKSQRVTAKLSAGDTSAIAVWLAPQPEPSVIDAPATLSDKTQAKSPAQTTPKTAPGAADR